MIRTWRASMSFTWEAGNIRTKMRTCGWSMRSCDMRSNRSRWSMNMMMKITNMMWATIEVRIKTGMANQRWCLIGREGEGEEARHHHGWAGAT